MTQQLFTIGHSTRPLAELVDMLRSNGVRLLVDVRTVPKSRTNPQFNRDSLEEQLQKQYGIQYVWMGKELGGLRRRDKSSELNAGWDNASFRAYADYMQTEGFEAGLQQLMQVAAGPQGPAAIMCAEVVYFRCHRALVSDALTARGWAVKHIINPGKPPSPHKLTSFAVVKGDGCSITYPAYEHTPRIKGSRKRSSEGDGTEGGSGGGSSSGRSAKSSRSSKGTKTRKQATSPTPG